MRSRIVFTTLVVLSSLAATSPVVAQNRVITGRVFDDANRQGISSALLQVVGGPQAAQANEDGQFRLNAPARDVVLNVRALGYRRLQVRVPAAQASIDIAMTREALQLTEVVVTGAATTQERRNVATAVSTVSGKELADAPSPSLEAALQGKVVGTTINMNSGAPGGGGQIQIRGVTSILGNGQPLYVVDGVIVNNDAFSAGVNAVTRASGSGATSSQDNPVNRLADFNPNDIESVQVLKSAAASAIYGSMATNGVVLITTKRGRAGAPRFSLSQRLGTNQPERLLGSRHFTRTALASLLGDTAQARQYCPQETCPYYDYQGELFGQRGLAYETSLASSGGNEQTKYYVSANDKNEPGTMINTGARRQNLRLNIDQSWGGKWTANANASIYRSTTARGISNNDNTFTSPFYAFGYTPAVIDLRQQQDGHPIDNLLLRQLVNTGSNPFQTIEGVKDDEDVWRQVGGANISYAMLATQSQTLTLSAAGGFDRFDADGETYSPNYLQFEPDDGQPGTAVQAEALSRQFNGSLNLVHTYTPSGARFLPGISTLTTSAGVQYEDRDLNRYTVVARGLLPGIENIDQGNPTLNQTKSLVRNQALYASEELLALDERLSVSGHVRAERSSVNGDRNKYFYWPGAAVSYRLVNLIPHADEIKLRGSVGVSGNQPLYGLRDNVLVPNGLIDGRNAIATPSTIGNPEIRPEKMRELEVGLDGTFFDSRAGLEASVYDRTITDMLLTAPLPPSSGFSSRYINGGEMKTRGLELGLNVLPIRNRTFTWTSRAQFYTFTSRMVSLPPDVANFVLPSSGFGAQYGRGRIARGQKTTLIWGNRFRCDADAFNAHHCAALDSSVVDTAIADANPRFQMAFSNDFTWKGFSLSALVDWRDGGYVSSLTTNLFDEGQNSWDYDKPSPDTTIGRTLGAYRYKKWDAGRNAHVYVLDGSYVKLREITLTYAVPSRLIPRVLGSAHDARLTFSGRNLYMWTPFWSLDPEVNNFGNQNVARFVDLAPYPPTRTFLAGFDVTF
ncbi:MAG TPA: SusC/RagA family TonB-linked outer membrane protein [Gemmatimonadaceae bacterium]|nr:SusC/RagA family TonB-linked outer membrane protein [Gemmatimonadaceae bacterium]